MWGEAWWGFEGEFLTLGYAEAVLLVDNDEAEVLKLGVVGNEGVSADNEVDVARF